MYLISRSSNDKILVVELGYVNGEEENTYVIKRTTYQYQGKKRPQPDIIINEGKVKRTVKEQLELQLKSKLKEYLDKGYKRLSKSIDDYTEEELNNIIGKVVTNQEGLVKPQLAKQADSIKNKKVFDKKYGASRKIDGVRGLIYKGKDSDLHIKGRGSAEYDAAMCEILNHPKLINFFKENPNIILDGECYKHGMSLQDINSIIRTQKKAVDYSVLQFYLYDVVVLDTSFSERMKIIDNIKETLNLGFDPEREFNDGELRIQVVPHVEVSGWDNIMKLHNEYVSEGWEGVVIRLLDAPYKPNSRTSNMIKVKLYKDDVFKVIGKEAGLRGVEDMVFILETKEGKHFKAKPFGNRLQKEEYWDNFEEKYNGQMGECKFFYYSNDNVPLQPSFKAFRFDIDD